MYIPDNDTLESIVNSKIIYLKAIKDPVWSSDTLPSRGSRSDIPNDFLKDSVTWLRGDNYIGRTSICLEDNRHYVNFESTCFEEIDEIEYYSLLDNTEKVVEILSKKYYPGIKFIPSHLNEEKNSCVFNKEDQIVKLAPTLYGLSHGNQLKNNHGFTEAIWSKSRGYAKIIEKPSLETIPKTLEFSTPRRSALMPINDKGYKIWSGGDSNKARKAIELLYKMGFTWVNTSTIDYRFLDADYYIAANGYIYFGEGVDSYYKFGDNSKRTELFLDNVENDLEVYLKNSVPPRFIETPDRSAPLSMPSMPNMLNMPNFFEENNIAPTVGLITVKKRVLL